MGFCRLFDGLSAGVLCTFGGLLALGGLWWALIAFLVGFWLAFGGLSMGFIFFGVLWWAFWWDSSGLLVLIYFFIITLHLPIAYHPRPTTHAPPPHSYPQMRGLTYINTLIQQQLINYTDDDADDATIYI